MTIRANVTSPEGAATRIEVIPNGVDTAVFAPGSRTAARQRLGWPQEAFIAVFAGAAARSSFYKDYPTMREAVRLAAESGSDRPVRLYVIGDTAPPEPVGAARVEFLPYRPSLSECYQAADVYEPSRR